VCACVWERVWESVCVCAHARERVCIVTCVHTHAQTACIDVCMYAYMFVMYVCSMHVCIHMYVRAGILIVSMNASCMPSSPSLTKDKYTRHLQRPYIQEAETHKHRCFWELVLFLSFTCTWKAYKHICTYACTKKWHTRIHVHIRVRESDTRLECALLPSACSLWFTHLYTHSCCIQGSTSIEYQYSYTCPPRSRRFTEWAGVWIPAVVDARTLVACRPECAWVGRASAGRQRSKRGMIRLCVIAYASQIGDVACSWHNTECIPSNTLVSPCQLIASSVCHERERECLLWQPTTFLI